MKFKQKIKLRKISSFFAVLSAVLIGIYLAFRLAFFWLPFLIAFAISSLMEPLIRILYKKLKIKRKFSSPVILLLTLAILVTLVVVIITNMVSEIKSLVLAAPGYFSNLYTQITNLMNEGTTFFIELPPEITDNIRIVLNNLSVTITNLGKSIVKGAFTTAISLPEALIFTIITILATYFMSSDRDKIASVFEKQLPESWYNRIRSIKNDLFTTLFGYLRAYLIIMCMTFTELYIGFIIIRVKYALLLAFIIAVIDILPVLGTGGVLIPWSVYSFITGNIKMGISILILYLVITVIRQIVEPKVIGQQIGVYPLLTLLAMYTGLKLIGVSGLIIGPVTFVLVRNILSAIYKGKTLKEILGFDTPTSVKNAAEADE